MRRSSAEANGTTLRKKERDPQGKWCIQAWVLKIMPKITPGMLKIERRDILVTKNSSGIATCTDRRLCRNHRWDFLSPSRGTKKQRWQRWLVMEERLAFGVAASGAGPKQLLQLCATMMDVRAWAASLLGWGATLRSGVLRTGVAAKDMGPI